jgi:hypothetical protein
MRVITSISELPNVPAVYAMYGGRGSNVYVAYVGIGGKLKMRIEQHLRWRDSSIVTGVSAVSLNPELVTEVRWWEHSEFADKIALLAAELVAFDVLEPALRSRGGITAAAKQLYDEVEFKARMTSIFSGEATGRFVISTLQSAFERIADLERRVTLLEKQIQEHD